MTMPFELFELPYLQESLEPHIDEITMRIHHQKHHKAYVDNLNKAMAAENIPEKPIEEILKNVSQYSTAIRNNGGGHYNHILFWTNLSPNGGGSPSGPLAEAIQQKFDSFTNFKEAFSNAAATQFGSGWAWLCVQGEF